jgi:hypothetical protein
MIVQDLAIRIETCIQAGETLLHGSINWKRQRRLPPLRTSRIELPDFWARGTFGTRTVHRRATAS